VDNAAEVEALEGAWRLGVRLSVATYC